MNGIKVDFVNEKAVMTRAFAKKASDPKSMEYAQLMELKQNFPNIQILSHTIKKNPSKESYKGLTYEYMKKYIALHEEGDDYDAVMEEFNENLLLAECHSSKHRYPTIKAWFLKKYPQVAEFGIEKEETKEEASEENTTAERETVEAVETVETVEDNAVVLDEVA